LIVAKNIFKKYKYLLLFVQCLVSHEPTAVKRDPNDQEIAEGGQTGTNTEEAKEKYKKQGMTKT
jgi:hypothetical protein